jgi:hypothetical protein
VGLICGGHDEYALEALNSVLTQTAQADQIVVLMNGRSSEVENMIEARIFNYQNGAQEVAGREQNIFLDRLTEHTLTSDAMKRLISQTTSEFLVMVGDDDVLDENFVQVIQSVLTSTFTNSVIVTRHAPFLTRGRKHVNLDENASHKYGASPWKWLNRMLSVSNCQVSGGGTVFPVSMLQSAGALSSPVPVVVEDWIISLRIARHGYKGVYAPNAIYKVRERQPARSGTRPAFDFGIGVFRGLAVCESSGWLNRYLSKAFIARDLRSVTSVEDYKNGVMSVLGEVSVVSAPGKVVCLLVTSVAWLLRRVAHVSTYGIVRCTSCR